MDVRRLNKKAHTRYGSDVVSTELRFLQTYRYEWMEDSFSFLSTMFVANSSNKLATESSLHSHHQPLRNPQYVPSCHIHRFEPNRYNGRYLDPADTIAVSSPLFQQKCGQTTDKRSDEPLSKFKDSFTKVVKFAALPFDTLFCCFAWSLCTSTDSVFEEHWTSRPSTKEHDFQTSEQTVIRK
ncbi:hypothetical protein BLNAU_8272 [Blattamonas nauphoetae]|uniref:Uncharacterized protein n=1 Tax=Blattamonas nauphoetae TaxID=2049346 RepID=A0ABQ9XZC0_9EUKA|nr:hypothetical protein BLNAU_8272 [Blattamonas nauphoetae]